MNLASIAERLKYERKRQGLSQEELAMRTNVTARTIQRIEKGEVNPHLQTVKLLAAALNIEVDDLIPLDNPKEETVKKQWLLLLHATPLLGMVLPLFNILVPLFLWIHKREDNPLYDQHGAKVVNFQITATILLVLSFVALLTIPGFGFLLFISVIPLSIVVIIINVIKVMNSDRYWYPFAFTFVKPGNRVPQE